MVIHQELARNCSFLPGFTQPKTPGTWKRPSLLGLQCKKRRSGPFLNQPYFLAREETTMSKVPIAVHCAAFLLALSGVAGVLNSYTSTAVGQASDEFTRERRPVPDQRFQVDVVVNGL